MTSSFTVTPEAIVPAAVAARLGSGSAAQGGGEEGRGAASAGHAGSCSPRGGGGGGGGRDGFAGLTAGGRVGAGAGDGESDGRQPSLHVPDRLRLHAQPGLPAPPGREPPRPTAGRGEKSTIHFLSNSIPWACHSIWEKSN